MRTRSRNQGFPDADVAAAVALEMIHPTWRQRNGSTVQTLTQTYLLGYVTGAVDALLPRRGVPDKALAAVRTAALAIIFSNLTHLEDVKLASRAEADDFEQGWNFGRDAVGIFLAWR